jgi:hypothetical protein
MATFTTIVSKPVTFTTTTNVVNLTAHGFNANVAVKFSVITTTTGITVNTFYYVIPNSVNTFKLSNTINGTVLTLTNSGTGTLSAVSRSDLATAISATNNIISTTSFKFLPEIFKFSGIKNMLECISFDWIINRVTFKAFSGINAMEHATFEFIGGQVFKKFSGINSVEHGTFKFLPEIFKFTGIQLSKIISYEYIPRIDRWKKFSGSTVMFALSVKNLARIDRWKNFSGVANILEALSIIIPPSREIGTRFTFAGISKLLIPLSIIIPPSREIGTRFTFAGLGTIIASTAKISDFTEDLKFSALNVIATSTPVDWSQQQVMLQVVTSTLVD